MKKTLASLLILSLYLWGIGISAFFPSLRLLQDTPWNDSFLFVSLARNAFALLIAIPIALGFLGWSRCFKGIFFLNFEKSQVNLLGLSLTLAFFSLWVFGLAVNEILYWPLTALFFIPVLFEGWKESREIMVCNEKNKIKFVGLWLIPPMVLWAFEYFSPPIVWDAILDHFRFAREVSRLHQILFHWTNHTGDMPKAGEMVLAGFWNLGGEKLSRLSSAIPAFLTFLLLGLFVAEWKGNPKWVQMIFWTCPFFMALFSWGYVEGFLAFYEVLALYCFWKTIQENQKGMWSILAAFFWGFAFVIKYTAVFFFFPTGIIFFFEKFIRKNSIKLNPLSLAAFALPLLPWVLKNYLAFGDPVYPLAISTFGSSVGYSPEMEKSLLLDTGLPSHLDGIFMTLWNSFFTITNSVNAAWTPLAAMSLPWFGACLKKNIGMFLFAFSTLFFMSWLFFSSSFRHAAGGSIVCILLASMAWQEAFSERRYGSKILFVIGVLLSLAFCLSTQLTTTAPYASALGLEDPLLRLKRNYSFDSDTYKAYQDIEKHSEAKDKVLAFGVFQTYPLQRIAFVDFKWKKPVFLEWASHCKTAEDLSRVLREKGVRYFLYQKWEARAMSREEKDFRLEGMPVSEYVRFWQYFMDPVGIYENSFVYLIRWKPRLEPQRLELLPGFEEKDDWVKSVMRAKGG